MNSARGNSFHYYLPANFEQIQNMLNYTHLWGNSGQTVVTVLPRYLLHVCLPSHGISLNDLICAIMVKTIGPWPFVAGLLLNFMVTR